jgi:hypothetical protein
MVCICGHSENDHGLTGRCRVAGCVCDHFQPVPEIAAGQPVPGVPPYIEPRADEIRRRHSGRDHDLEPLPRRGAERS